MPLKFNVDAAEFVPAFCVPPELPVNQEPDSAVPVLLVKTQDAAPHLQLAIPPAIMQELQEDKPASPAKRPPLPRINSGMELTLAELKVKDTLELEFDDVIESPHVQISPYTSPSLRGRRSIRAAEEPSNLVLTGAGASNQDQVEGGEQGEESPKPGDLVRQNSDSRSPSKVDIDSFQILHMIGEGGFGKVFQVRRKETGRIYAMKCMRKDTVLKDNLAGTKTERSLLEKLKHPYIVTMHFAFQCRSRLYIVMDYFPGGQFLDMLQHHAPFEMEACRIYSGQITLALEELHKRGIVHRDLKPENLLVDSQGNLSVTDFGCSKVDENQAEGGQVRTKSWAGTELYMAPEQLDKKEYGSEVDWWALGALVWEMATGDHPFYSNSRKAITHNIMKKKLVLPAYLPASCHSFLKGLLTRDPSKRLGHAGGADEVLAHGFFKGLDFKKLMAKEIPAPLRSHAKTCDELDVSGHSERYTKAPAALSPIASPHQPSASMQKHFEGFSWSHEHCFPLGSPARTVSTPSTAEAQPLDNARERHLSDADAHTDSEFAMDDVESEGCNSSVPVPKKVSPRSSAAAIAIPQTKSRTSASISIPMNVPMNGMTSPMNGLHQPSPLNGLSSPIEMSPMTRVAAAY